MARAIDVDDAIKEIRHDLESLWYATDIERYERGVEFAISRLEGMKTIDPVKHGKWKFHKPDKHGNKKPYCSECREYNLTSWSDYVKCKVCPNCGAVMIGYNIKK